MGSGRLRFSYADASISASSGSIPTIAVPQTSPPTDSGSGGRSGSSGPGKHQLRSLHERGPAIFHNPSYVSLIPFCLVTHRLRPAAVAQSQRMQVQRIFGACLWTTAIAARCGKRRTRVEETVQSRFRNHNLCTTYEQTLIHATRAMCFLSMLKKKQLCLIVTQYYYTATAFRGQSRRQKAKYAKNAQKSTAR